VDNDEIARMLDAYAALLDLARAAHWSVGACRRAAELIRETPAPVEELDRSGRARELRRLCAASAVRAARPRHMRLAVTTARRGWATAGDVLNTQPLAEILKR
jgi:hypothetical protein